MRARKHTKQVVTPPKGFKRARHHRPPTPLRDNTLTYTPERQEDVHLLRLTPGTHIYTDGSNIEEDVEAGYVITDGTLYGERVKLKVACP